MYDQEGVQAIKGSIIHLEITTEPQLYTPGKVLSDHTGIKLP